MDMKLVRPFMVACACTAALAAAACDNTANRDRSSTATPAADTSASKDQPVTLTGCLMKGDGRNDFILTKANEPIGTTGSAAGAATPAEKTLDAAAHSYRLDGDNDQLDKLVGHKVRVSGTIADRGDLDKKDERGTSGSANKDREIKESDLAKVTVKSVESIAPSCDQSGNPR